MRALIFLVRDYLGIARLPGALVRNGFQVAALCPSSRCLVHTRHVVRRYNWPPVNHLGLLLRALAAAITDFAPDVIIPGDQYSAKLLMDLAAGMVADPGMTPHLALLKNSLGDSRFNAERIRKGASWRAAKELGLRIPAAAVAGTCDDAIAFATTHGYPVVLKSDLGVGGYDVRVCRDPDELTRDFKTLHDRILVRRRLRRWGGSFFWHLNIDNDIGVYQFIRGKEAMRAVAVWQGEVVAGISTVKEMVHPPLGPATRIRFIHHPEMADTARALVRRWGASGFLSFDYMIGADDGQAYLLECNPRPVPITHLGAELAGSDLCAALAAVMRGVPPPAPGPVRDGVVALFPQEWQRDPASPWLRDAYHDVPWDDPALLLRLLKT